jgi:hypothetical protein
MPIRLRSAESLQAMDEVLEAYSMLVATRRELVNLLAAHLPKGDRSTTTTPEKTIPTPT